MVRGKIPRLYPILDAGTLRRYGIEFVTFARALREAGATLVQYRDKESPDGEVLERVRHLRLIFPQGNTILLLNDRAHLCKEAGSDGVHLGQEDMPAQEARALLGPDAVIGVSTHNVSQLQTATAGPADYLAIGPVFPTHSKEKPDPVVGVNGVAAARRLTAKPLVAIGGITRENAKAVLDAGADAVAVITGLLPRAGRGTAEVFRDFLADFR